MSVKARNEARVRAALDRWESKLRRARNKVRALRSKVRRYERERERATSAVGACACCSGRGQHGFRADGERALCSACRGSGRRGLGDARPCRYGREATYAATYI